MSFIDRERPPGVRERRMASNAQVVEELALHLEQALQSGLQARGAATLLVSGGRSPKPLFNRLQQARIDWSGVIIGLVDERWVPPDDPESNERLVRQELLQGRAAQARFIPLKNPAPTAQQGAAASWAQLAQLPRPFDAVVLGMGDDGHTASLFPGSPGIVAALDPASAPMCVAMSAPVAPNMRISLNLAALLQTSALYLHIEGERKWEVYREAARAAAKPVSPGEPPPGPPIAAFLRQRNPGVQVYWAP
jgi:6-phosphogluconolactonase